MQQRAEPSRRHKQAIAINVKELIIGIVLFAFGFVMPLFVSIYNIGVMQALTNALQSLEKVYLLEAALRLVLMNAIRIMPLYLGVFFIGGAIELNFRRPLRYALIACFTFVILRLAYLVIDLIYHVHYDFALPSLIVFLWGIVFDRLDYRHIRLHKKATVSIFFLTAVQFLDVMPMLENLPIGRGETSYDIKITAIILEADGLLNVTCTVGIVLFSLFALLMLLQIRSENSLRQVNILREQNEEISRQAFIAEMKNRTNQEVQYLVHDLKSPLTAIQTIVDVLKIERERNHLPEMEYLERIEHSVERMDQMISEMLHEGSMVPISTETIVNIVLAQCSATEYASYLYVENNVPTEAIFANRILLPRAIINLLKNSAHAVRDQSTPSIRLIVDETEGYICFTVADNGIGIDENRREHIWGRGISGSESSGLGLAFVQSVVTQMNGIIRMDTELGKGTSITILLPKENEDENTDNHSVH